MRRPLLAGVVAACAIALPASAQAATLVGTTTVQTGKDSNTAGRAEAFTTTASATGAVGQLSVYLDASSTASKVSIGLYANASGHPGALLTSGTVTTPHAGAWNSVDVASANVTSGTTYWLAVLGPTGSTGTVFFRDKANGTGAAAETSSSSALASLPQTWSTGTAYRDAPISAYASTATAPPTPVLSVTPTTLAFSATQGAANPAAKSLSVTNTGTGTLSFTTASDAVWLSPTPASGTAPATVQVAVDATGLDPGTYTGHVIVTSTGSQGSPATVTVTLTVSAPTPPTLAVSPSSLSFSATQGASNPAAKSLSVTNTGSGSLSFTSASDAAWLSASPASGSAPATVQVSVDTSGLAAATYTGHVTITSTGSQGSPASIPVTLTVNPVAPPSAADWLQIEHDSARSGFASGETTLTSANVPNLSTKWSTGVDGKVTAAPLYVANVTVNGATHDVVVAATSGNSIYALDASSGAILWRRNFGTQAGNCAIPGGYGITGTPAIDKAAGRIYTVSDDGNLHSLKISDGTDAASALALIDRPATNKVWGGLNLSNGTLYVATASDGCDTAPWRGRVYRVDVSGAAPQLMTTWVVVPSIAAPDGGGGIWGYGGVSVDTSDGHVYVTPGDDSTEAFTPYADRMVALDAGLNVLGSWEPTHPTNFPCSGAPCDLDFGATPLVFKPSGCPTMAAAGSKDGNLYVEDVATLAQNGAPKQTLRLNAANDWLGSGGVGGVPAYWPDGRMVIVTDVGPGVTGISGGVVGLHVKDDCTLEVAWSTPLGGNTQPDSTPTVANGVVFVGEGNGGKVHAYDATNGHELWSGGGPGATYAAPIVANGTVYAGSWDAFGTADKGTVRAFAPGSGPPPPPPGQQLLGTNTIGSQVDQNATGQAEAFEATATASGALANLNVYLDSGSATTKVVAGIYADASGHPGALLGQVSTTSPSPGTWNNLALTGVQITSGTRYWIALLGATGGTIRFRDKPNGCHAEVSQSKTLTALPATWASGASYTDCPLSTYGTT
jgi:outer membrane protein assembly factor BamB